MNARDGKLIETLSHFRHLIRDPHMWGTQRSIYSNLWSYASLSMCLGSEATERVVWVEFRGK
ncbi:MAG: hypothetical protein QXL29_03230 [Zestosphaera sp.]